MPTLAETRAAALQAAFVEAARRNEWGWIADEFYADNCEYLCEYGGTMKVLAKTRAEIKATHYGREMLVGWEGIRRVHGCLIHVDIIDRKIWIQRDGTERGVARDLIDAGVPREQIVLAFQPDVAYEGAGLAPV